MSKYAVIVQNDESEWDDIKGDLYNFPKMYQGILTKGSRIIYYKGKLKNKAFASARLTPHPHYFGVGEIGNSILDPESEKGDLYCEILNYQEFQEAVLAKGGKEYLEPIPKTKMTNYWRSGVRKISEETYYKIVRSAVLKTYIPVLPDIKDTFESYSHIEGTKKERFSSYYERIPFYRNEAISIHGTVCKICDFDFEATWGALGKGFIHVHHIKPISESGPTIIDPKADLTVLCPNCHAMIHRKKNQTPTLDEAKALFKSFLPK